MTDQGSMRASRLPFQIARRVFGTRHPVQAVTRRISNRVLSSFRSSEPGPTNGTSARVVDTGVRVVLVPLARAYAGLLRRFSVLDAFLPTDHLDWVRHLQSNWRVIREELDRLRSDFDLPALIDMIPGEQGVTDARWKMFIFRYFGQPIEQNCALCPRTALLLERIPGLVSANFSVLQPGARIAAHQGIFAGMLRYHLGLIVPERVDLCGLRVGNERRHWREGSSLLFDETREHEAWNLTDQDRVVLLVDVKRKLPTPLRWLNDVVLLFLSRVVMAPLAHIDRMVADAVPRLP
jgi:aspartyl/asparaginyl beta-hydroxylase (cupin superfamily)